MRPQARRGTPGGEQRSAPPPSEARPEAPARRFRLRGPLDLAATLAPLRHGSQDPTIRIRGRSEVLRATLTPEGPATEYLRHLGDEVEVEAWGPGATWALEHAPELVGERDDPKGFHPEHPVLADLARRLVGVRLGRSEAAFEALVPAVLEQKYAPASRRSACGGGWPWCLASRRRDRRSA